MRRIGLIVAFVCAVGLLAQDAGAQGRFWVLVNGALRYTGNVIITGTVTTSGAVTSGSTITSGNHLIAAASSNIGWTGRLNMTATPSAWTLATSDAANTFGVTLDDAKTTLSGEAVSYAQDATGNLGVPIGLLTVTIGTTNKTCVYVLSETATTELSDPGSICTITKDNAATVNIYWDTNAFFIQNRIAGTRAIRAVLIGG